MPAQPPDDTPLDHANRYAAHGLRVMPIRPGQKAPSVPAWPDVATVDPKTIAAWWGGLYRDHGIGLAMGTQPDGRNLFALDVDAHNPTADGADTLAELEAIHGRLPDTPTSLTGGSGLHMVFDSGAVVVTNGAAGAVGPGIDVRGHGGQIVVAPTVHPNGRAYQWENELAPWDVPIAAAPAWLLELVAPVLLDYQDRQQRGETTRLDTEVTAPVHASTVAPIASGTATPADTLRAGWDWHTELEQRGWQHARTARDGTHWTRPGKDPRHGTSAVLHGTDGPLVVFTTDASLQPMWRAGKIGNGVVSLSPLAYVAAYDHGGDLSAAARALRVSAPQTPLEQPTTVTPRPQASELLVDWSAFWQVDYEAEEWVAWPLLPAGRQVALYAPAKTGKSIITLAACAAAATGKSVLGADPAPPRSILYLDYEMTAGDLHERLDSLGYSADDDLTRFHYALLPALPPLNTLEGCAALVELAAQCDADAVVIDTMGRAVQGEENSADSYREFARTTGLALKAAGRAVLRTDHAGKDRDKGQRGSSAKNDDVDIVYRIDSTDGGWRITRTHSRVAWAPDKVAVTKVEADDRTEFHAERGGRVYLPGTRELVADMRALGLDADTSRRSALEQMRAAGHGVRARRVDDALAWMRAEQPRFGAGHNPGSTALTVSLDPTPEPNTKPLVDPHRNHPDPLPEPHRDPPSPPIGGRGPGLVRTMDPNTPREPLV